MPLTRFVVPRADTSLASEGIVPHYGKPGGVLPVVSDARLNDK